MKNKGLLLLLSFTLLGCAGEEQLLKKAMEMAGENRVELQKVLDHYKDEPLKLAAAEYLISYMPYHPGIKGTDLTGLQTIYRGLFKANHPRLTANFDKALLFRWRDFNPANLTKVSDLHHITATYLIENIEYAFLVWEKYPWNGSLSFDDFCQFILPYRLGDEPLENWRKMYFETYAPVLDSLYNGTDVVEACRVMSEYLRQKRFCFNQQISTPHMGPVFLFDNFVGYCKEVADITCYVMRSVGIPVCTDYTVISPEHGSGHDWNAVLDTTGQFISFYFLDFPPSRPKSDDGRKKGKVYRRTWHIHPERLELAKESPDKPSYFENPWLKDVSANYYGKNELIIDVPDSKVKTAWLCVFNRLKWSAIDMVTVKNRQAVFHDVGDNLIYQVQYNDHRGNRRAGYPFTYRNDSILYLVPQTDNPVEITVNRKYPLRQGVLFNINHSLAGATIDLSADPGFRHYNRIFDNKEYFMKNRIFLRPDTVKKYRYLRITPVINRSIELAELVFYEDMATGQTIPYHIVNAADFSPYQQNTGGADINNIKDGEPLTFYSSKRRTESLVVDLGGMKKIDRILLIPRNDENFVCKDDMYELFYNNGAQGWISLGKKVATSDSITYEAPENALLWLRNINRGKEEQVFIYQNNKQLFASDL